MLSVKNVSIPTPNRNIEINFKAGTSIVFIGANGAGKTRLGVFLDQQLSNKNINVHRIAAHRSLILNPNTPPVNLEVAQNRLLYGSDQENIGSKKHFRFKSNPATVLLSDFDYVLSSLYAENNDVSIEFRQHAMSNTNERLTPPLAKFDKLQEIWEKLLPHRKLIILGNNLKTTTIDGNEYSSSEMSDGERVIFYLIAQALLVKPDTLLIFDEPELHINRSILDKLWDEIEASRPDCCFVYITHDIDFASSRNAATRYAVRSFQKSPHEAWDIDLIPFNNDLPEDIIVTIVGSRKPVLFIEGDKDSLDFALYRRVYDQFTVIPVGGCEAVIHTVSSFAARPELHRIGCAGLVDADARNDKEAEDLKKNGIYRLPVSEVENLLLLPKVLIAIAITLNFTQLEAKDKLDCIKNTIQDKARQEVDTVCLRYTKRRLDSILKKISSEDKNIESLNENFKKEIDKIDPKEIFDKAKKDLINAIDSNNYENLLLLFDNKGLLSEAAKKFNYNQKSLEDFIFRSIRSNNNSPILLALEEALPEIRPKL